MRLSFGMHIYCMCVFREWFSRIQQTLKFEEVFVLLCLVAMGQIHVLLRQDTESGAVPRPSCTRSNPSDMLLSVLYPNADECRCLAQDLLRLETFYNSLGGLLGYQMRSLQLLSAAHSDNGVEEDASVEYLMPRFLNLSTNDDRVKATVRSGIQAIPYMAEIYALGGSGDRLGLQCPESGHLLPSAMLPYCGRSMLDSMIRDLQVASLQCANIDVSSHNLCRRENRFTSS